jgi:hypothetical protein
MVLITVVLLVYFWRRGWIFQIEPEIKPGLPAHEPEDHDEM